MGSNPIHSVIKNSKYSTIGSASVLGTGGYVFKSHYFDIFFNMGVITQLARVFVLHTKGYQFKSGLLQECIAQW
jgi:hypothetical protein